MIEHARHNPAEVAGCPSGESQTPARRLPANAIELVELRSASIEHRLGYFQDEPYVLVGYCLGAGEVIWRDGRSSGFGVGGWRIFLYEIAPLAARHGANIGDLTRTGTHVLLLDRIHKATYAASRESAEEFLAAVYGLPPPRRRCLCALMDCNACPCWKDCHADHRGPHR